MSRFPSPELSASLNNSCNFVTSHSRNLRTNSRNSNQFKVEYCVCSLTSLFTTSSSGRAPRYRRMDAKSSRCTSWSCVASNFLKTTLSSSSFHGISNGSHSSTTFSSAVSSSPCFSSGCLASSVKSTSFSALSAAASSCFLGCSTFCRLSRTAASSNRRDRLRCRCSRGPWMGRSGFRAKSSTRCIIASRLSRRISSRTCCGNSRCKSSKTAYIGGGSLGGSLTAKPGNSNSAPRS
mmetsp:Transcript_7447/g.16452  ORF Transcript_7447/g.16452 Transcript_7447/m.16452 type:complete len:236 (+) Transcript_7447:1907-2614(+)